MIRWTSLYCTKILKNSRSFTNFSDISVLSLIQFNQLISYDCLNTLGEEENVKARGEIEWQREIKLEEERITIAEACEFEPGLNRTLWWLDAAERKSKKEERGGCNKGVGGALARIHQWLYPGDQCRGHVVGSMGTPSS